MSAAEWTDRYSIHHWTILGSSYRKLTYAGFEDTTTEFRSDVYICIYIFIFMAW